MSPKKPQPDYASGPGGALAVSAKQQDQTPLLSKEVERSDKSPSSKSPPSKSMSLREQKRRADDRSPSPARGGVTRSCRCDKICYLRMINYALDMLEGDTGEGLEGAPRRPNRAARLLCCLLITVSLVIGLYFSWGYISGAVMAGLGVIGSAFGPIFSGLSLPQLPDLTSMSPATMYASFSGFCVSSYLVMMDFVSKSYVWFMGGGLLPHEIMALPAAKPCMPWDVDCKLPPQVARAMDDVETCPDGLILAGGRATPVFGVGTLLFLFWVCLAPRAPALSTSLSLRPPPRPPSPLHHLSRAARHLLLRSPPDALATATALLLSHLAFPRRGLLLSLARARSSSTASPSVPTSSWRPSRPSPHRKLSSIFLSPAAARSAPSQSRCGTRRSPTSP